MEKQSIFTILISIAFIAFFIILTLDDVETKDEQVYGRNIIPYKIAASIASAPLCIEKEERIGKFIYTTCDPTQAIADVIPAKAGNQIQTRERTK